MRRWIAAGIVLMGAGFAAAAAPGSFATTIAPAAGEEGTFTLRQGGRALLTERFQRTADRLDAVLSAPGEERVSQTATLAADGTVPRLDLRVFAPGAAMDAEPMQQVTVRMRGDTAVVEMRAGGESRTERVATRADAIPIPVDESLAMLEQVVRRARMVGGARVQVPVLGQDGETEMVTVAFMGADSARITADGADLRVRTDEAGRLLSGSDTAQDLTFERSTADAP